MPRLVRLFGITLAIVILGGSGAALAASPAYVEVREATGARIAAASGSGFDHPRDGSLVHVGSARRLAGSIELTDVRLLGARVRARRILVPDRGFTGVEVDDLVVDGARRAVGPNTVVALPGVGYLIANQQATDGAQEAVVGLRVHTDSGTAGLHAGGDILVAPSGAGLARPSSRETPAVVSPLGFSLVARFRQTTPVGYPLATRGVISACPFIPGSTHSPFAPPDNLESDDAIDINVPVGTPVLAVADGVIGPDIGSLHSIDPRMQGLRVHLDTLSRRFYYAHLSRLDVAAGQHVRAGQQIGLSGSAAGVAHLHFAQDGGNPAETIGEPEACPFFIQYAEAW